MPRQVPAHPGRLREAQGTGIADAIPVNGQALMVLVTFAETKVTRSRSERNAPEARSVEGAATPAVLGEHLARFLAPDIAPYGNAATFELTDPVRGQWTFVELGQ